MLAQASCAARKVALQQRSDCKPLAATTDTNLIDEFEDRGYVTAFDVVGNGGLSDEQLKEVGLTKMWAPEILILHRISASLAGFRFAQCCAHCAGVVRRLRRHYRKKFKLAVMKEADKQPEMDDSQPSKPKRSMAGKGSMPKNIPTDPAKLQQQEQAKAQPPPPPPPPPPPRKAAKPTPPPPPQGGELEAQLNDPQQLAAAGMEHYRAGRLPDAVEHYQAAADLEAENGNPVNPQLIGMLAQLQDAAGQKEEAVSNYELAIHCPAAKAAPANIIGRMKMKVAVNICSGERYPEAQVYFEEAVGAGVTLDFTARHAYGMVLTRMERQAEAEVEWEAARKIAAAPGNDDPTATTDQVLQFHSNVGMAYFRQGKMDMAAKEFEAAHKADKSDLRCLDMLSTVYMHLGRDKKAVMTATNVLKHDTTRVVTRGNLAMMLARQGKLKKAVGEAKKAIEDAAVDEDGTMLKMGLVPDTAYNAMFLASWMQGIKKKQHLELAESALVQCAEQLRKAGRTHDADSFDTRLQSWRKILAFTTENLTPSHRAKSSLDQLDAAVRLAIEKDAQRGGGKGGGAAAAGLFLEFGVRYGATLRQAATIVKEEGKDSAKVHGFDSFEGLPDDWVGDAAGTYSTSGVLPKIDEDNTKLHVGWFNETLPAFLASLSLPDAPSSSSSSSSGGAAAAAAADAPVPVPVAYLHLDADLYSSTKEVLHMLCSSPGKIVSGTVIEFDEYFVLSDSEGWDQHEAKAWKEIATEFNIKWEFLSFWTQRFSVVVL